MLAIRMQRTGRKGHAMFRVVVQDSRLTPTSGKVVAQLGSYDPHAKAISFDKEKAAFYLEHGAQPSDRVARLFKSEGLKLPEWVKLPADKKRSVRNSDKRRSTRPPEEAKEEAPEAPTPEAAVPEATEETNTEATESASSEVPTEEVEAPAPQATETTDQVDEIPAEKPAADTPLKEAEDAPVKASKSD